VAKRRYGESMGVFEWFRRTGPSVPTPKPAPSGQPPFPLPTAQDLYDLFGVSPNAGDERIRQAFKEQALKFHPDRNPDDPIAERKYREISEAYRILVDPQLRAAYDRWRAGRPAPAAPPRPPPTPPTSTMIPVPRPIEETTPRQGVPRAPMPPVPAVPAAPPSRAPSFWETFYGPVTEQEPSPAAFFTQFRPTQPEPAPARPPSPSFARPQVQPQAPQPIYQRPMPPALARMDVPSVQEVAQMIYHTWPLEEIWAIARAERQRPAFAQSGLVHIDQIAGFRPGTLEYELGEDLGLPSWFIEQFLGQGRPGFEALWNQVFAPMFQLVTAAFDGLKPTDLPGRFGIDIDPQGTRADLLYSEGRR